MIKFSSQPLQSDISTLRFVAQKNETFLRALDKSDIDNITAILQKSNLVEKPVLVHGKHTTYWSTRKVNPDGKQTPAISTSQVPTDELSSFLKQKPKDSKIPPKSNDKSQSKSKPTTSIPPSNDKNQSKSKPTMSFAEYLTKTKENDFWWIIKDYTRHVGDAAFLQMVKDHGITTYRGAPIKDDYDAQRAFLDFVVHHPELYPQPQSRSKVDPKTKFLKKWKIGDPSPTTTIKYNTDFTGLITLDTSDDAKKHFGMKNSKSKLTWKPTEKKTISEYIECSDIPYYANAFVRDLGCPDDGGRAFAPDELKGVKKFVDTLDGAIAKSELTTPIMVHRKVVLFPPMIDALTKLQQSGNNILTDKGFCSTTAVESSLHNGSLSYGDGANGQVIFHIKVPAGKGVGAWIAPVAPDKYADQNEFLLPRGTQFRCTTDISKINWKNINPGEQVHINLEVIGRKFDSIDTIFHKSSNIDYSNE